VPPLVTKFEDGSPDLRANPMRRITD